MRSTNSQAGFTLIEVLVVSPIIILAIGAIVGSAIALTGSALHSYASTKLQNEVLEIMDIIEEDTMQGIKLSDVSNSPPNDDGGQSIAIEKYATSYSGPNSGNEGHEGQKIFKQNCQPITKTNIANKELQTYEQIYYMSNSGELKRATHMEGPCRHLAHQRVWERDTRFYGAEGVFLKGAEVDMSVKKDENSDSSYTLTLSAKRNVAGGEVSYSSQIRLSTVD